jgi:hypothetical protein
VTPGTRRRAASALVVALLLSLCYGEPARADDRDPYATSAIETYRVTMAARICDSFRAIAAGRVRDDADELVGRPGIDSPYRDGAAVSPDIEDGVDANCTDLPGQRFTIGTGHQRKGNLSVVTGVSTTTEPTKESADRLDDLGKDTGGLLGGAVTATLTADEVRLATRRQLWVQGGTPDQPVQSGSGFGALRCAVDGHTGGNVQWVTFPAGVRHVFCFAYYVRSPGATGTVTVRVKPSRPIGYPRRIGFQSDLSHAPEGKFGLTTTGDAVDTSFTRAAGSDPYPLVAQPPDGWKVAAIACSVSHSGGGSAASTAVTDPPAGKVIIVLAPGDLVACEYTVDPPAQPAGLSLKVYAGGIAAPFQVGVAGATGTQALTATTTTDPVPVAVTGPDLSTLAAGTYAVAVGTTAAGLVFTGAVCNGGQIQATAAKSVTVNLVAGVAQECVLRVSGTPPSPRLNVLTKGGVATAAFAVAPADRADGGWWAAANSTGDGTATAAAGEVPSQPTPGSYVVTAIPPRSDQNGGWKLGSFSCSPADMNPASGAVARITVALGGPPPVCTATYEFEAATYLQVTLKATGFEQGRDEPAVIEVSCVDGSAGRVVLESDEEHSSGMPQSLAFLAPTECTVAQRATGAVTSSEVTTSATLDPPGGDGPLALPTQVEVVRTVAKYTVAVTDHFGPPAEVANKSVVDELKALPVLLVGIGVFFLGALIFVAVLLRRRAA